MNPLNLGLKQLQVALGVKLHPEIAKGLRQDGGNAWIADTRCFLEEANKVCKSLECPSDDIDIGAIQQLFSHLALEKVIERPQDGDLHLIRLQHLVTAVSYPELWRLFFLVPGDKGHGLDREDHGKGYHVHYVATRKGEVRTNAIFTFNPIEPKAPTTALPQDTLHWYKHSGKIKVNPDTFRTKSKKTIYGICVGFLTSVPKSSFITPPRTAHRLWP